MYISIIYVTYKGDISCGWSPKIDPHSDCFQYQEVASPHPRFDSIFLLVAERVSFTLAIVTLSQSQPSGSVALNRDPPPLTFHSTQPL